MKITKEFLERGGTISGNGYAWKDIQAEIFGEKKTKGWTERLIGKKIPDDIAQKFLELNPKRSELFKKNKENPKKQDIEIWNELYFKIKNKGNKFFNEVVKDLNDITEC